MHVKVAQCGLGPIGLETLRLAAKKPWAEVVGAVDIDPTLNGIDLGKLTGVRALRGRKVYSSLEALLRHDKPEVIFQTTVSRFEAAFGQIAPMVRNGLNVVSSCEELIFPQLTQPKLTRQLDQLCRSHGARVVAAGVNPGFVMDLLPLCLSGVSCSATAIHVRRVVNASTRRAPLQRKIGSGSAPASFRRKLQAGLAGHAGLKESLALLAHALQWRLDEVKEIAEPVVARRRIQTQHLRVEKGQTCGIHQRAEGKRHSQVCLTLDLRMYLDAADPHDAVEIIGQPPLSLLIPGGIAGDQATVGALINTAPRLLQAAPGLHLVTDLPVPRLS